MNKLPSILNALLSLALVAVVFWMIAASPGDERPSVSHTDTLYILDSSKHASSVSEFHTTNNYTVMPANFDTAAVVSAYFTKKVVRDVLEDSLIRLQITDSVYMNGITYRARSYQLLKPHTTITTTTLIPATGSPRGLYAGPFFSFGTGLQAAGLEASYVSRRYSYGLGYDFKSNAVQVRIGFKVTK